MRAVCNPAAGGVTPDVNPAEQADKSSVNAIAESRRIKYASKLCAPVARHGLPEAAMGPLA